MTDPLAAPTQDAPHDVPPSWKRIGEFLRNILKLERAVEVLKSDNKDLREQVRALQRQLDDQSGQLAVLTQFVSKALDDKIASRAEDAAIRAIERMNALTGGTRRLSKD